MSDLYILKGKEIIVEPDVLAWGKYFSSNNRRIKKGYFGLTCGYDSISDVIVSTVFLGVDHQFGEGMPILFETMVFGGEYDEDQERCSTYDEALKMHYRVCEAVKRTKKES